MAAGGGRGRARQKMRSREVGLTHHWGHRCVEDNGLTRYFGHRGLSPNPGGRRLSPSHWEQQPRQDPKEYICL